MARGNAFRPDHGGRARALSADDTIVSVYIKGKLQQRAAA